ncbi:MAG: hypothetical protein M1839_002299 [Geoglossum umbratile]|nr:MAG: hypothetical protein M1839_002299 [Geoglossum umbratile]
MASDDEAFAPPPHPPPPKVPEGWKALWNEKYQEWFYVNTLTKKSQWEKPTSPARSASPLGDPPLGPPPAYSGPDPGSSSNSHSRSHTPTADKKDTNPFRQRSPAPPNPSLDEDARLAAKLQAEEDALARSTPVPPGNTYSTSNPDPYFPQTLPPRDGKEKGSSKGLIGRFFGGGSPHKQHSPQPHQQPYGGPPQPGYGNYPPPGGYPYYPQQGGYYPPQQQQQQHGRRPGGGLGAGGAAALGLGGGLLGGVLLADAIDDHNQAEYDQGYDQGFGDGGGGFDGGGFDGGGGF